MTEGALWTLLFEVIEGKQVPTFGHPWLLLLAIPAVLGTSLVWARFRSGGAVRVSDVHQAAAAMGRRRSLRAYVPGLLQLVALLLLTVAAARPRLGATYEDVLTEGIDIVMTLDVSSSMLCEDFRPQNRLQVSKEVLKEFVESRKADRIGLVVFSGKAFTKCPLTLDYEVLLQVVEGVGTGEIEDGTGIGLGIATAANRLREAKGASKIIVLLTDGRNNKQEIDPRTAAQVAKSLGIKIYCVGAGTRGQVMCPVDDPMLGRRYVRQEVDIDEELLRDVARTTGGLYFRATDKESLEEVYRKIGELEKTKAEVREYTRYTELFPPFVHLGIGTWLLGFVLGESLCRVLP